MNSGLWISPTEFRSFADQDPMTASGLSGQIATRLAAGDLSGFMGLLPNPDPILKAMGQDQHVYRNLLVDPLIKGIRRRRSSAVLAMERGFDRERSNTPARVLKACNTFIGKLNVQQLVRDLNDGAFFGYRVGEVMWRRADGLLVPDLICKPGEWFGFDATDASLRFKPRSNIAGIPVDPRKFIVVGKMRSWENPFGEADLAACFWAVAFKRGGLKFWVAFTEKYGMPWAVGKLPRQTKETEVNDLAEKLARMVRDAVAVIPDDASVELLQTGSTASAEMYKELLMFCRSEISIALLGNNQSVEMQSNKASAEAAAGIEAHLRDDDAEMVADGLNQLVRLFCQVNFPGAEPPVYCFWEQEEVDDVLAGRDEKLRRAGANFSTQYFERVYNLQPGDLAAPAPASGTPGDLPADGETASFADLADAGATGGVPVDQAVVDAAIEQLPADAITAAMRKMLAPALRAIESAGTPEEVRQALEAAWPEMDATDLQELMTQAFFVADLVGRDSVQGAAQ